MLKSFEIEGEIEIIYNLADSLREIGPSNRFATRIYNPENADEWVSRRI